MKKLSVLTALVGLLGFTVASSVVDSSAEAKSFLFGPHTTEIVAEVFAQQMGKDSESEPQSVQVMPDQKLKIEGVIVKREADSFTLHNDAGSQLTVRLSTTTKVKERKNNPFRGAKSYSPTDLIPGLNVWVEGRGDSSGAVVAEEVKLKADDLTVARTIQTQVVPVKNQLGQVENRLGEAEQNAQRLSGQVEELTAISNLARGGAKAAQETADAAITGVQRTNERISALDDYQVQNSMTINFKVGSAELSPEAMALLDEMASEAKTESGFVIEVAGFASADGNEAFNRQLSRKRAEAVVRYLVDEHEIPLRRILMPYGFGELHPVADNATHEGRQQNRRVEVKLLVNRGLTEPVSVSTPTETSSR